MLSSDLLLDLHPKSTLMDLLEACRNILFQEENTKRKNSICAPAVPAARAALKGQNQVVKPVAQKFPAQTVANADQQAAVTGMVPSSNIEKPMEHVQPHDVHEAIVSMIAREERAQLMKPWLAMIRSGHNIKASAK